MRKGGDWDKNVSWSGLESDIRREWVGKSWSGHCQTCTSWGRPWGKVHYLFWSSVSASQPAWKETESGLVLASQQAAVAQTMTHGHVPTPNNIMLAPLLKNFKEHFILDILWLKLLGRGDVSATSILQWWQVSGCSMGAVELFPWVPCTLNQNCTAVIFAWY